MATARLAHVIGADQAVACKNDTAVVYVGDREERFKIFYKKQRLVIK